MATTKNFVKMLSKNGIYFCHSLTSYEQNAPATQRTYSQIHTACEVFILLSGKVTYVVEGKRYEVYPGEMVLIPPFTTHFTFVNTKENYERMVVEFSPELLPKLRECDLMEPFNCAKIYSYVIPKEYVAKEKLKEWFTECKKTAGRSDKFRDLDMTVKILSLSKKLHTAVSLLISETESNLSSQEYSVVRVCIEYINKNIEKDISVKKLSEDLHISQSHLFHSFKNEIGETLHDYIVKQKMDIAKKQIQRGTPPTVVAVSLGYEYYSTFFNNFVKTWGITPNDMAERETTIEKSK